MRLLIVGNRGGTNIGGSLERAAIRLGLEVKMLEPREAWTGSRLVRSFHWRFRDKKPNHSNDFNRRLMMLCDKWRPHIVLCTGIVPVSSDTLSSCASHAIRANFLTDDPWSPFLRANWFIGSLRSYDMLFTPRRANMPELMSISDARVVFLRFGFDADLFRPDTSSWDAGPHSDVIFAGGADAERIPYITALNAAGVNLALYGDYWHRFRATRRLTGGQLQPPDLRAAIAQARTGLCLVRRANRDGHSMRTFEMPAVGTSMLVEDTEDHRELFGPDWRSVAYFSCVSELVDKTRYLLRHDAERNDLLQKAHQLITCGRNTYQDRLREMLAKLKPGSVH